MSLFPYSYRMIESFNITQNESTISIYAGMLITAFAFAEFTTGMIWGRISDRIGRKPVLVMGLVGTAISMVCFGFATNLWTAIIARALGGFLNGNVGVLQTTVAELVKKKEHQPRAYSIMPFVWCLGSIIGPAMGGALAMPVKSYPSVFSTGGLFEQYPFLLPNLVCVTILIFGITNGILFIEETHPELKHRRDRGRELGDYLVRLVVGGQVESCSIHEKAMELDFDCPTAEELPGYRTTENSPLLASTPDPVTTDPEKGVVKQNKGIDKIFSKQVIYVILGYGILAFHSVSFDAMMPVMLSEAPATQSPVLPFKFSGGFGMTTKSIGFMMAVQGVYSMVAQLWFFPFIVKRVGTLTAFRAVMLVWPILYFLVPYLVLLPHKFQSIGIYAALLTKITFHVIAFPSNAILLANAAPSKSVLGTINGAAASTACLCRAFGPTISGAIHSAGLRIGYNGFAWWAGGVVCLIGALEAYFIQESDTSPLDRTEATEDPSLAEALMTTPMEETDVKPDPLTNIAELDLNDTKTENY